MIEIFRLIKFIDYFIFSSHFVKTNNAWQIHLVELLIKLRGLTRFKLRQ